MSRRHTNLSVFKMALQAAGTVLPALALYAAPPTTTNKPAGSHAASATPLYVNREYRYAFQPPAGWTRQTSMPKQVVAYLGPEVDNFSVNLTVNVYTRPVIDRDLDKFADGIKIEHAEIYDKKSIKLDGRPAYIWRTHLKIPDHPAAENWEVVSINNGRAYELVFTVPPSAVTKYQPVFEKWLASFTWTIPTVPTKK